MAASAAGRYMELTEPSPTNEYVTMKDSTPRPPYNGTRKRFP